MTCLEIGESFYLLSMEIMRYNIMFFKKKYITDCTIICVAKNMIYGIDDDGRNKSTCEYQFVFIDREKSKILYKYDDDSNLYQVDKQYKAKFNEKDGSFKIIKEV